MSGCFIFTMQLLSAKPSRLNTYFDLARHSLQHAYYCRKSHHDRVVF